MKAKNLKRALVTSAVSLCACVAMLAGSTFAWFTDSVTSGSNTITAGNLDVELYRGDSSSTTKVDSSTTDLFSDVTLWEPGAAAYEVLTIANEGTLDLRYSLQISITSENSIYGYKLSDVLQIGYVEYTDTIAGYITNNNRTNVVGSISNYSSFSSGLTISKTLKAAANCTGTESSTVTYLVVVYWEPGDNDNNYNTSTALKIDFTAKLLATQAPSESDGFDNTYDGNATIEKDGVSYTTVSTTTDLLSNIATADSNGEANVALTSNITLADSDSFTIAENADVSIDLNGYTLDLGDKTTSITVPSSSSLTITDGDFDLGLSGTNDSTLTSLAVYGELNMDNVTLTGKTSIVIPCTDNVTVNINNCTLTSDGTYCVATNANGSHGTNYVINITNSIITANDTGDNSKGDDCAVMINVPCTLNISDSVITGDRQGVMVRVGTANITNSTITTTGDWVTEGSGTADTYMDSDWKSGNEVPMAALVVGNRNTGAWQYAASCTLSNVNLINELYSETENTNYYALYAWGNSGTDIGATVTVGSSCNYTGLIKKGENVTFNGITETSVTVSTAAEVVSTLSANTGKDVTLVLTEDVKLTSSNLMTAVNSTAENASDTVIEVSADANLKITETGGITVANGNSLSIVGDGESELEVDNAASIVHANFYITEDSSVTLSGLDVTSEGSVLYPSGNAAQVNVINSTIKTSGAYCVATNAGTVDNYSVEVKIEDSTLITETYSPICFNVPGTYKITNSVIATNGASPCAVLRGGDITIDGCKFYNNMSGDIYQSEDINAAKEWNAYMDDYTGSERNKWGSGNATALATLCVGNDADSSSYQYATNCTVKNTEIHATLGFMCVYVEGNSTQAYGVTFTYDNCSYYYHTSNPYTDTTGGIAYANTTPTQYSSSLFNSTQFSSDYSAYNTTFSSYTNPLNYAIIYTNDSASYVTINGTGYCAAAVSE